ncbi:hypothetical protein G6O67_003964 [Ophiocordyceps sinensis]|uniref:Uncharacterized protein n=1 Tax=Ophiocordyceps sinensis TaxID=72228 RepID=A0A8H4PMA5_9HYPO|nr:hypothetical protein G6O67_003964 [Ophiocordyceps sinensis]
MPSSDAPAPGTVAKAVRASVVLPAKEGEADKKHHEAEPEQQPSLPETTQAPAPDAKPSSKAPDAKPSSKAPDEKPSSKAPDEKPSSKAPDEKPSSKAPDEKPSSEAPDENPAAKRPTQNPAQRRATSSPNRRPRAFQQQRTAVDPSRRVLMEPPERVARQHPHMAPPPYVHHFDSYSLVKQLQQGGYTPEQATTAMKGIRTLLAHNLDGAQQSLVSKSNVENETYLFTAACSELSTEIKNNRRLQDEQMRQQRTLLQNEVEILAQSLTQELLTLNDNVRGMFNDRKMAVPRGAKGCRGRGRPCSAPPPRRREFLVWLIGLTDGCWGRGRYKKITYKMSILLSSDCKSEIEGVRWILIRRSVLGIIFMAILTLGMLRYATDGGKTDHSLAADAAAILAAA